ncbi:erythroblast NAD(P)(+)--arginine ADP-ribosyltransferase-like [Catharus ustulatus]|uniref:erythroblast NAD(P)(+)--arginine ADP-ribosyltransferase-like n=1 Tax=Catharus ustulatus TaxID=91951 RepID=UPI00140B3D10|nr:erythroblast NAD(P)(+)--arginine ADP-ribosyltransferase-like [Catharus ustulatus]
MALLALTLALLAITVATMAYEEKPLDMALDSFDDQYQGCGPDMEAELPALNHSEFQSNSLFAQVWPKAVANWQIRGSPVSPLSSSAQAVAIMAYTMSDLYKEFNDNVRKAGRCPQTYQQNFHFKTLHFLLTDALAKLRDAQGKKCHCVIRGVKNYLFHANVGDIVRFGQFASSSICKNIAKFFGTTTVFEVHTCHGADIQAFSRYPYEKEVLIPPYEKFIVTKVIPKGNNVEIHLNTTGTHSKFNCGSPTGWSIPRASACSADNHQGHQDSQRNEATKATKATAVTMAALASVASMRSLRPPLAL